MDFKLTEEQQLLLESFRELLSRECTEEYLREIDEKHQPGVKVLKALADNGFSSLGIPEEYGGTPVDDLTLMLLCEEYGRSGGPSGWPYCIAVDDILTFGSEEQKKITLEYAQKGVNPFSLLITEPGAGSDNSQMSSTATRRNGKVYLNGHKTFVTGAKESPYMLVMTKEPSNPNPMTSMSMWWVPRDAKGITIEPLHKIGWHDISNCEVYLEDVEVEEKDIMGVEGQGFIQLMKNFETERLMMAARVMGMAQAGFEDAARYANQRVQFGQKIGNFQLIQEKLTYMAIKIENMKNMVYKCAWEKDNGISIQVSSALTKLYVVQSSFEVLDDAMQILGGIGYTMDHRVSRLWRDARVYRMAGGTDQIMVHIAGRGILKKYK
ncbi:acyl-CoA dehydrogenase [Desulfitobacterium chlororespirans]|uniref:Medium-chain specific acyl-CoA dehydrogenase, mitochondrial n=1 Tax=Desulfitobacterium chlororespirans DSM 11544 TaxID=1121395 RepID=A0A1M7UZ69_9FIRM|nr:acyl-CoA dehydrogenase [Desulfitobacterium chlororespirans]SHN88269.1 Acyl-CoA dehydrogenase [Desulfitobacterium chlororespirans DSM 11544]